MPFFTRQKQSKYFKPNAEKRKKVSKKHLPIKSKKEKVNGANEIISSDEDDFSDHGKQDDNYSSEEETHQEKKLRLTKKYLEEIEKEEKEKAPADDSKQAVAHRLHEIALEEAGRLQKKVAHEYANVIPEVAFVLKGHNLSVTCLVLSNSEKFLFSGSKDCSLIKWSLETGQRWKVIRKVRERTEALCCGHMAHILAIAISTDDKFLATGGKDKIINIWNPDTMQVLKTLRGHKSDVTALIFNKNSHQLISASSDRSLKLWNIDEMGYIETLFGHQDAVTSIDCFHGETALTSGGRDNTLRIWKIAEESQLVYQGQGSSTDCVCVSSPQTFISGADDGSLSLWGLNKKKPLSRITGVHGQEDSGNPHWVISLCSMPNTDLIASGSQDGRIRLWRRDDERRSLEPISDIPVTGFVNAMVFAPSGTLLISAMGQEHRLGRWWKIKEAKNVIIVHKFPVSNKR